MASNRLGDTIGLSHNMKASNYRSMDEVFDDVTTQGVTTASIMDYSALVIAKPGQQQGDFFVTKPGPYDADDMRSPGHGIVCLVEIYLNLIEFDLFFLFEKI